jgi:hypothetical protein
MKKALIILAVVLSFIIPFLAWAQQSPQQPTERNTGYDIVNSQPRGAYTVYLRDVIILDLKNGSVEVSTLQVSSVGFGVNNSNMVAVQITRPEYNGRIMYVPITNIKVIIANK